MIGEEPAAKRFLRRAAQGLARALLRVRARPLPAGNRGVTLVLSPHQDDDVLGCGGLVALRRLRGLEVHVVYITDGSASHPGHPVLTAAVLASQRTAEARAALRVLGVETPAQHFLHAPDGRLERLPPEQATALVEKLAALLRQLRPDEIYLPAGDDGSSEHDAAFAIFRQAYARSGVRATVREIAIWAWWSPRLLARKMARGQRVWRSDCHGYEFLKARALAAHRSQTAPVPPWPTAILTPWFCEAFLAREEFFFESPS